MVHNQDEMKKIYAFVLALIPLMGFGQFTIDWNSNDYYEGYQGDDKGFYYFVTNANDSDTISITWKFTHDLANSSGDWEDYMCEGLLVCWPSFIRDNTFKLGPGEEVEMNHHIQTFSSGDSGTWVSTAYIWQADDSANTVQEMVVTFKTGLTVQYNGQTIYIMDGDTFEMHGSELVPLSVYTPADMQAATLSQNAPNPFRSTTSIAYSLKGSHGVMKFQDLTGKLVMEQPLMKQSGNVVLTGKLDAGIYFYSLWENGVMIDSKRMQVVE